MDKSRIRIMGAMAVDLARNVLLTDESLEECINFTIAACKELEFSRQDIIIVTNLAEWLIENSFNMQDGDYKDLVDLTEKILLFIRHAGIKGIALTNPYEDLVA